MSRISKKKINNFNKKGGGNINDNLKIKILQGLYKYIMGKDMPGGKLEHCKTTLLTYEVFETALQKKTDNDKFIFESVGKEKMETIITNLFNIVLITFYLDYYLNDIKNFFKQSEINPVTQNTEKKIYSKIKNHIEKLIRNINHSADKSSFTDNLEKYFNISFDERLKNYFNIILFLYSKITDKHIGINIDTFDDNINFDNFNKDLLIQKIIENRNDFGAFADYKPPNRKLTIQNNNGGNNTEYIPQEIITVNQQASKIYKYLEEIFFNYYREYAQNLEDRTKLDKIYEKLFVSLREFNKPFYERLKFHAFRPIKTNMLLNAQQTNK